MSYGENIFPKLPKNGCAGANRQFQAKTPKQNLYIAISSELLIRRTSYISAPSSDHEMHFVGGPPLPQSRYNQRDTTWLTATILKIDMTSYFRSGYSDLNKIRQPDAE